MALAIQGVREEERTSYEAWKQLETRIMYPPESIVKTIYIPVKYDEYWSGQSKDLGDCDFHRGGVWCRLDAQDVKKVMGDMDIDNMLRQSGLLTEWRRIELGVFSLISVGKDRYVENHEIWWSFSQEEENETYWHGIRLERGDMDPSIMIAGARWDKCVVNIMNKNISPNVARNNLADEVRNKVILAIERAAHQYIADNLTDDKELQTALQAFINKNYPHDNPYYLADSVCIDTESGSHCSGQ